MIYYTSKRQLGAVNSMQFAYIGLCSGYTLKDTFLSLPTQCASSKYPTVNIGCH